MTQKIILRPKELAEALDISRSTLYRMEKRGELPKRRKISENTRGWPRSEIIEWLENRPVANPSMEQAGEEEA